MGTIILSLWKLRGVDMNNIVYLALGSNLGDRFEYLRFAIDQLKKDKNIMVSNCSSVYETSPVGFVEQGDFLNMVLEIKTTYAPLELLKKTQAIEGDSGRVTKFKWGPRTLDLDILLYNQENINLDILKVPHPRMFTRGFVIIPLREITADIYFPTIDKTIEQLYQELSEEEGVRVWKRLFGEGELEHSEN